MNALQEISQGIEEYYSEFDDSELDMESSISTIHQGIDGLAEAWKEVYGIDFPEVKDYNLLPLVAEAINWMAKVWDDSFYSIKPKFIDAVVNEFGHLFSYGWGDDGVFYIENAQVGTVCFHDPNCEIVSAGSWDRKWSGITRQELSHEAIANPVVRRLLAEATLEQGKVQCSNGAVKRMVRKLTTVVI